MWPGRAGVAILLIKSDILPKIGASRPLVAIQTRLALAVHRIGRHVRAITV